MQAAIKVPPEVHKRLKEFAEKENVTMGTAITTLLDEHRRRFFYDRLERETADEPYLFDEFDDSTGLTDTVTYLGRLASGR